MAAALTQMGPYRTGDGMQWPIVIKGRKGVDYDVHRVKVQTSSHLCIGLIADFRAGYVDEVDYAAHGTNGLMAGIVIDSAWNKKRLQMSNSGAECTKALFFTAGDMIEIAMPRPGCIISVLATTNEALEINSKMEVGGAGIVKLWNDGTIVGRAKVYQTAGTGVFRIAMEWTATGAI